MKAGNAAWCVLGTAVAAFEVLSTDKLSHTVDRALERPYVREATIAAIGLTALHLVNLLPEPVDPYFYIAKLDRFFHE